MSGINDVTGEGGVGYATGAVIVTAPGGKKIYAIGVIATANITSLTYTPPKVGNTVIPAKTVVLDWMAKELPPVGPTAFIPLGFNANSLILASGTIIPYFRPGK